MNLLYPKKGRLNYKQSQEKFEDAEVPFEPFSLIREDNNFVLNKTRLIIGYTDSGDVIVLGDDFIVDVSKADKIEAYKISNHGLSTYYKRYNRKKIIKDSIFRKPKVGDTLLCVADGRYLGCKFGDEYIVNRISSDGRLFFDCDTPYSYEDKYFIVVKSGLETRCSDSIQKEYFEPKKKYFNSDTPSAYTSLDLKEEIKKAAIQRKSFIESEDVKKQTIIVQDELITRKKITKTLSKRNFFETKLIKRKTNNL